MLVDVHASIVVNVDIARIAFLYPPESPKLPSDQSREQSRRNVITYQLVAGSE